MIKNKSIFICLKINSHILSVSFIKLPHEVPALLLETLLNSKQIEPVLQARLRLFANLIASSLQTSTENLSTYFTYFKGTILCKTRNSTSATNKKEVRYTTWRAMTALQKPQFLFPCSALLYATTVFFIVWLPVKFMVRKLNYS